MSYRVIYRKDSIPAGVSVRSAFLKHVHGAVYIRDGEMQAGEGPASAKLNTTIADHAFERYAEAFHAVCLRHFERDRALGGEHWAHRGWVRAITGRGRWFPGGLMVASRDLQGCVCVPWREAFMCKRALGGELWA